MSRPTQAYLVANARFHDTDYARLELLKLLSEHEGVRTRVAETFADTRAIAHSDFLITYTCDLRPTEEEETALHEFVESGGKWIALHGTNAILDFKKEGIECPMQDTTDPVRGSWENPIYIELLRRSLLWAQRLL